MKKSPIKLASPDEKLVCSFCGKTQTKSEKMITGFLANICGKCAKETFLNMAKDVDSSWPDKEEIERLVKILKAPEN